MDLQEDSERVNILLVDDMPEGLLSLEAILGSLGQNLVKAQSGQDALRQVLAHDFAVILLDVQMPVMDGYEVAKVIRDREASRHIPIIFLTANNLAEVQTQRGYQSGAVDFLFKPLDPEILQSKVRVFVELAKQASLIRKQTAELILRESEAKLFEQMDRKNRELLASNQQLEAALAYQQKIEAELEATANELKRSNAELEQFAYIASHDLQEPLRMVASYVALFAERYQGQVDEKADKWIHHAVDGAKRMQELINGLLLFSRVTHHAKVETLISSSEVLDQTLANLQIAIETTGAQITRSAMPAISADPIPYHT